MNIGLLLLIIIGGSVGALSTLYIVVSLIGTIAYKIFRTTKYHVSLYSWSVIIVWKQFFWCRFVLLRPPFHAAWSKPLTESTCSQHNHICVTPTFYAYSFPKQMTVCAFHITESVFSMNIKSTVKPPEPLTVLFFMRLLLWQLHGRCREHSVLR